MSTLILANKGLQKRTEFKYILNIYENVVKPYIFWSLDIY
jgi:hypothetical protein